MSQPLTDTGESVLPAPLLVVEDDPLMQIRLRTILATLGYAEEALWFAGSLADANALLTAQPFAMVLVDVGLPDGNGIDLIRALHERDPALPTLVISTWNTERVIVSALQAGATGYLLKERDDLEISLSIRSALRGGAPIDPFVARHILDLVATTAPLPGGAQIHARRLVGASYTRSWPSTPARRPFSKRVRMACCADPGRHAPRRRCKRAGRAGRHRLYPHRGCPIDLAG